MSTNDAAKISWLVAHQAEKDAWRNSASMSEVGPDHFVAHN